MALDNITLPNMTFYNATSPILDNLTIALTTPIARVNGPPRRPPGRPRFMGPPKELVDLQQTFHTVNMYVTLPIIIIGLFSNIVLIYAMKTSRLKNMAYTVIVASLAGGECGYLAVQFINWLSFLQIKITEHTGMCQFHTFIHFCFTFLPPWYLLGLLAERCRALCIIYLRKPPNTKFRVRLYIFLITSLCVLIYSICLWAFGVREIRFGPAKLVICGPRSRYVIIWRSFQRTDIVFSLVFPIAGIVMIFPFNVIFFAYNHTRTRAIRHARDRNHSVALAYRDEKWFTISVLVTVIVHIILSAPYWSTKLQGLNPAWRPDPIEGLKSNLMQIVCHGAHAIKPFLFFAINPALRKKVARWFQPLRKLLFRDRYSHASQRIPTNLC